MRMDAVCQLQQLQQLELLSLTVAKLKVKDLMKALCCLAGLRFLI
jgi:hypothetical protein